MVAIVGTRRASADGLEMATTLGRGLARAGVTVVSGMALGIDSAAHRGALDGGGATVAVLAGAAEIAYPRSKATLHAELVSRACAVSELPPGFEPFRWCFPARNRIIAGLAQLTLVVEGAERSGSLITADFAGALGREVAAVPGRATSPRTRGSNGLIRDGATVVLGVDDVLDAVLGFDRARDGAGTGRTAGCRARRRSSARSSTPSRRGRTASPRWRRPRPRQTPRCSASRSSRAAASCGAPAADATSWRAGVRTSLRAMPPERRTPVCLTIAGSDSGGGAGIQADLKAFAAAGAHGASALTALTAQNTLEVSAVLPVPPDFVVAQVRAVVEDLGVDAVKLGMLGSVETIAAVAEALALVPEGVPVVVDPVMVAESGARLLDLDAVRALVELILPRATVVTPNLMEARVLAGAGEDAHDAEALARAIHALGPGAVVVTGGHRTAAVDVLFDGERIVEIEGPRHPDGAAHGSGCTHASTLAAHLAHGFSLHEAAFAARRAAGEAVRLGLRDVGAGAGPVDVLDVRSRTPLRQGP